MFADICFAAVIQINQLCLSKPDCIPLKTDIHSCQAIRCLINNDFPLSIFHAHHSILLTDSELQVPQINVFAELLFD